MITRTRSSPPGCRTASGPATSITTTTRWGPFVGTIGVQGYHNGWDRFGTEKFLPPNRAYGIGVFGFEQADLGSFTLSVGTAL